MIYAMYEISLAIKHEREMFHGLRFPLACTSNHAVWECHTLKVTSLTSKIMIRRLSHQKPFSRKNALHLNSLISHQAHLKVKSYEVWATGVRINIPREISVLERVGPGVAIGLVGLIGRGAKWKLKPWPLPRLSRMHIPFIFQSFEYTETPFAAFRFDLEIDWLTNTIFSEFLSLSP